MSRPKNSCSTPSLLSHLAAAVRAWWGQDRVRASPREGRLLRLEPPCIVTVDAETAELTHRAVGRWPGGPYVSYRGVTEGGCPCELRVAPGDAEVTWTVAGVSQTIRDERVSVFQRRSSFR